MGLLLGEYLHTKSSVFESDAASILHRNTSRLRFPSKNGNLLPMFSNTADIWTSQSTNMAALYPSVSLMCGQGMSCAAYGANIFYVIISSDIQMTYIPARCWHVLPSTIYKLM